MSNHLHLVLRTRPDVVAHWSDEEVARRWWRLFPRRRDAEGHPAEPMPHELARLVAEPKVAAERRRRLGSLSWLMRCLCEPIARRANREDQCTGRFWEGRFKCQALLDEAAVLACNIYVELNPVRAAVARTPEESPFTSAYERIHAHQARRRARRGRKTAGARGRRRRSAEGRRDGWLCPIRAEKASRRAGGRESEAGTQKASVGGGPGRRASSESFLSMSFRDYLKLLDWTGRQVHRKKRGSIPSHLAPILDRVAIDAEHWLASVQSFGRRFHRAAGHAEQMAEEAARAGRRWLHGLGHSRTAFG
jgi:hypothetical protein